MAATIGPLFAALASAPRDWNEAALNADGENTRNLKTSQDLGFEVQVYSRDLLKTLDGGSEIWVFFAQVLREDGETLYGFASPTERLLFTHLKDIDGIGAKFAATALMELGSIGIRRMLDNSGAVPAKLPGLGPKTLEKIKNGVKAKRDAFAIALKTSTGGGATQPAQNAELFSSGDTPTLVLQALAQVGLRSDETDRLYAEISREMPEVKTLATADVIKLILKKRAQYKNAKTAEATV